jgi:DNA sulfur modification protein DndC
MKKQFGIFSGSDSTESIDLTSPESIAMVVAEIRKRLRGVNVVSFSGGKDSTVTLKLVLEAMRGLLCKLFIITSDTGVEIPYFQQYVDQVKQQIREYIAAAKINAEVVTVRPPAIDSFWVSVLGKGYPAAHMGFRWCTGKLKIDPITNHIKSITGDDDFSVFIGVRSAESAMRAKIYLQKDYKPHHFAPVLDWSAQDIWTYLLSSECPWGDHSRLIEVYRYSSDECVYGEKQGVCIGNARYGCWPCPLQKVGQLNMIAYYTNDDRYLKLREFKTTLCGMANNRSLRSVIRRNGETGSGPFTVAIRKRLFSDLKQLEASTGWQFITEDEEDEIRRHWEVDEKIHSVSCRRRPLLWDLSAGVIV